MPALIYGQFPGVNHIIFPDQSELMKERMLTFSQPGGALDRDIESDPNTLVAPDGAPFFVCSPIAPSGLPTVGFVITLLADTLLPPGGGGALTLTAWRYLSVLGQNSAGSPIYTSLQPATAVNFNEEYVTFDVDACMVRFQITGFVNNPYRGYLIFCEL